MNRYIIVLILICFSSALFAQKNKISVYELDQIKGLFYQRNTIGPFTGTAIEEHSNGEKKIQIPIKEGKIHGTPREWSMGGEKIYEANFENGVQVGTETQWYATGQKKTELHYNNGKIDGIVTEWHKNGQKKSEGLFRNGKEEGEHNWWFSNGNVDQQVMYKNGLSEGIVKNWYESGQLKLESNYQSGKKQGLTTKWYQGGEKKSEEYFVMDEPDGKAQYWSKRGPLQGIRVFENGTLIEDINYRNGNIKTNDGYLQVFNEAESFFTVPVTGDKVKAPESQDIITYVVDGMLLQVFNLPISQLELADAEIDEQAILTANKVHESANISSADPEFQYNFQSEWLDRPDGKKMLHWYFKAPSSLQKEQKQRTVQEEHYISILCNKQVLTLYSAITNSDDPEKVLSMMKRVAEDVKIYKDRIDINRLAADILKTEK